MKSMVFKLVIDYYATNNYEIANNIQNLLTGLLRVKLRDWVREINLAEKHFMAVIAKYGMI